MKIVAGVDGGGTSTRVLLADHNGNIKGFGVSGSSNYGSISIDKVQAHINEAFSLALNQAELKSNSIDAVFMGMAGVVSEQDQSTIRQIVKELDVIEAENISVDHDIRISLAGGLAGKEGIALIAGTGSSCYGRRNDNRHWMSGGWGHLIDDRGSAYDIVRQALKAVVRAHDGRGQVTLLTNLMLKGLRIDDISDIMRRLYFEGFSGKGHPMSKGELASLAPLVIEAAEKKDEVARQILKKGVMELALMVQTVADKLDFSHESVQVVITGGTVQKSDYLKNLVYREIENMVAGSKICEPYFPPVAGAVLLALRMANVELNDKVFRKLEETMPSKIN
ncbi:MAG: BadF/BadG/BcrA/BcrD ATPase family protein [Balneolaceae bacterium]